MEDKKFLAGYTEPWFNYAYPSRKLVEKYNSLPWEDIEGKHAILKELLADVDDVTVIEPPFRCDEGCHVHIGKNFYANYNFTILDADEIRIGDNVVVGPNVTLVAADHPVHFESRTQGHGFPIITAPITIEDDVWIGAGTTILKGVTIGKGSVIGAHSLVTRDIPPMSIAVGSPAKVIRQVNDSDRYDWSQNPQWDESKED